MALDTLPTSVCLSQQAGGQILGHCSTGGSGKARKQDGLGAGSGTVALGPVPWGESTEPELLI